MESRERESIGTSLICDEPSKFGRGSYSLAKNRDLFGKASFHPFSVSSVKGIVSGALLQGA